MSRCVHIFRGTLLGNATLSRESYGIARSSQPPSNNYFPCRGSFSSRRRLRGRVRSGYHLCSSTICKLTMKISFYREHSAECGCNGSIRKICCPRLVGTSRLAAECCSFQDRESRRQAQSSLPSCSLRSLALEQEAHAPGGEPDCPDSRIRYVQLPDTHSAGHPSWMVSTSRGGGCHPIPSGLA